jgi:hypothetical protein
MSYKVGQVLYLLVNEEMKIVPVQVVEVVIRHRFNEDVSTSYNVVLPGKSNSVVNLDEIDASIFTDVHELRNFMLGNATSNIDRMVTKAIKHAENSFATGAGPVQEEIPVV